mmetsp:Transcript_145961/g.254695  ORF Transcript_145961/g.254695 Transcript_145961/m.254695 type:complete len:385 (+) Transcript_145961:200-1354(+)
MHASRSELLAVWCCILLLRADLAVGIPKHGSEPEPSTALEGTCTAVERKGSAMVQARHLISALSVSGRQGVAGKQPLHEDLGGGRDLHEDQGSNPSPKRDVLALPKAVPVAEGPKVSMEAAKAVGAAEPLTAAAFFDQQVASLAPSFVQTGSDESHTSASKSITDRGLDQRGQGTMSQPMASQAPSFVQMGSDESHNAVTENVAEEVTDSPGGISVLEEHRDGGEELISSKGIAQRGLGKRWRHWLHSIVPYSLALTWALTLLIAMFVGFKVFSIIRDRMQFAQDGAVKLWVPNMGEASDQVEDATAQIEAGADAENSEAEGNASDTDDQTESDTPEEWEIQTPKLSPRSPRLEHDEMPAMPEMTHVFSAPMEIQDTLTKVACR